MENTGSKIIAGLAGACLFIFCPAPAGAAGYKQLSARLMKCAEANAFKKIAVLEFSSKGGVESRDAEYAAEKIGLYLAGSKKTALIERALLERVLNETRLSAAADGPEDKAEILKSMLSLDAVVTGTVFPDGKKLMVMARLIDLKTGRVLLAAEAEAGRLPAGFTDNSALLLYSPNASSLDRRQAPYAAPAGLRDALAEPEGRSCPARRLEVAKLNAELVDAKARYWAIKMKAPGFSLRSTELPPGSEIGDNGVKALFYKLFAVYFEGETPVPPEPEKIAAVFGLLKMEKQVSELCRV